MVNHLGTWRGHLIMFNQVVITEHYPQQLVHREEISRSRTHQVPPQNVQHDWLLSNDLFLRKSAFWPPLDVSRSWAFGVFFNELRADENSCVAEEIKLLLGLLIFDKVGLKRKVLIQDGDCVVSCKKRNLELFSLFAHPVNNYLAIVVVYFLWRIKSSVLCLDLSHLIEYFL